MHPFDTPAALGRQVTSRLSVEIPNTMLERTDLKTLVFDLLLGERNEVS
jgi:hypothetical protein